MRWITAAEIDEWTNRDPRRAQELLPLLVGKLILASGKIITDYHFPYGKAVQFSGYDGILDTEDESSYYPKGKSVWEVGTNENIIGKFNDDYKKRTDDPNGIIRAETTYCFVTSRIWNHKTGISEATEEKNKDKIWKSVRIIDANNLELWMEACPSVQMWFAAIIGKPKADVQSLFAFWKERVNATEPQLNTDYFLYGRKTVAGDLNALLVAGATQILLTADSWLEAILLIAAEIISSVDDSIKALGEKCLVVHTADALNEADASCRNAVIIPCFNLSDSSVITRNNTILIPANRFDPIDRIHRTGNRIEIPSRTRHEFCEALTKIGYSFTDAYKKGSDVRCNFAALYRQICTDALMKIPEWSKSSDADCLIPAMFSGAWNEAWSGDKSIISALSGTGYEDYASSVKKYTRGEITTLSYIEKSYACISVNEMWDLLWNNISVDHFERFKQCFIEVFHEVDPAYELAEEEWPLAPIYGKMPSYSNELKNGMIVSLIMLVSRKDQQRYPQFVDRIEQECTGLVKQVLDSVDSLQKWQTICFFLPLLYEAAPDVVLRSLEKEAVEPQSDFWKLFKPSDDSLFGRNFYTNILWTLEVAVWDRRYAARAVSLLISYTEKGFTYSIANRPEEVLYHIFCIWRPQGAFTSEERKQLLSGIVERHHSIAPAVFERLLPIDSQTTTIISRPKWTTVEGTPQELTLNDVREMCDYLIGIYMEHIQLCYADWHFVFSVLTSIRDIMPVLGKCRSQMESLVEDDRLSLCKDLAEYIGRGRKYGDDDPERIDAVQLLYKELLPETPKRYVHYFAYHFDGLDPPPYTENYPYKEERERLYRFQKEMIREMVLKYGNDSVGEITGLIEDIPAYARAVSESVLDDQPDWGFILFLRNSSGRLAECIVSILYKNLGIQMLYDAQECLDEAQLGWLLSCLLIDETITGFIDELGSEVCEKIYWENVNVIAVDVRNTAWANEVVYALLRFNRSFSVIHHFANNSWNEPEVITEILRAALVHQSEPEPTGLKMQQITRSSDIERMFRKLYNKPIIPELEIASLELSYLRAFDYAFEPKCLLNQILSSPEIYFELLKAAHKPDDGVSEDDTEQKSRFAAIARTALERIHRIPGYSVENCMINEIEFKRWIDETEALARRNHYTDAHHGVLGRILSYSPKGSDGVWPAECVREIFEKCHFEKMENSFMTERVIQRGVYTQTAGKDEEAIAERYRQDAEKIQVSYPFTADILFKISARYLDEARHNRAGELKGIY